MLFCRISNLILDYHSYEWIIQSNTCTLLLTLFIFLIKICKFCWCKLRLHEVWGYTLNFSLTIIFFVTDLSTIGTLVKVLDGFIRTWTIFANKSKKYNCFLFACQWTCQIDNFQSTQKENCKTYQWQKSCICMWIAHWRALYELKTYFNIPL